MIGKINFVPGDIIKVYEKIKEGEKSRIQVFEGTVLGIKGRAENKTFMIR
ncbi:MAG: 50S ribosomal protein L19, partial [Patescibacteria group bacterium]